MAEEYAGESVTASCHDVSDADPYVMDRAVGGVILGGCRDLDPGQSTWHSEGDAMKVGRIGEFVSASRNAKRGRTAWTEGVRLRRVREPLNLNMVTSLSVYSCSVSAFDLGGGLNPITALGDGGLVNGPVTATISCFRNNC